MTVDIVTRLFDIAQQHPEHPAIVHNAREITYADFVLTVKKIAGELSQYAHQPKVMILLPQGEHAYASMFATAMAGGYYVPGNVTSPLEKQHSVIEQFQPDVIVSTPSLYEEINAYSPLDIPLINVENIERSPPLEEKCPSNELVYVIFTSGSTGTPKGVMVKRSGLNNYVAWAIKDMTPGPGDRWSQYPTIAFDLSVLDIYGALCSGATLYPLTSPMDRLMPATAIKKYGLTILNVVPSVVNLIAHEKGDKAEKLKTLRLATFCGEPLLYEHLKTLFDANTAMVVHNTYGPTEATVSCTLLRLNKDNYAAACKSSVAIGEPIEGCNIHLIGGPTPQEGEIVITGKQLAAGYWQNKEQTEKAFKALQINGETQPAYYTGDWAELSEGHIYFKTRIDFQVKINGYRVELDEVNRVIRNFGISSVISVVVDGKLHSCIEKQKIEQETLIAHLQKHLDQYAIPSYIHTIEQLPRNANDKIDSKAVIAWIKQKEAEQEF